MSFQCGYQIGRKLPLAFVSKRIARVVIAHLPAIATARLHHHDLLIREFRLESRECLVQLRQSTMVIRIIARTDDIVFNAIQLQPFIVIRDQGRIGSLFRMDYDLSLRTDFTTCLPCIDQSRREVIPVLILIAAPVTLRLQFTAAVVQHAPGNLIACLNKVGRDTSSLELFQAVLGVIVDIFLRLLLYNSKLIGCALLAGVCPRIAIVEVEHQLQPGILDLLAQLFHIVEILSHALTFMRCWGAARVDKQPDTHSVHTLFFQE